MNIRKKKKRNKKDLDFDRKLIDILVIQISIRSYGIFNQNSWISLILLKINVIRIVIRFSSHQGLFIKIIRWYYN